MTKKQQRSADPPGGRELITLSRRELAAFASTVRRLDLARALGQKSYGGLRNYNTILGYPVEISFDQYQAKYDRQDIAGRIVDLPAADTWKMPPELSEDGKTDTPFCEAWAALVGRLRVFEALSRLDKIAGIGRYGVLLIGLKGDGDLSTEAQTVQGPDGVIYLRPLSEGSAELKETESDTKSPRYGLPTRYAVRLGEGSATTTPVHWSRTLHVADNRLDSLIYGRPRLKGVFNRLEDLMKLVGGSAEATWLNMRPGMAITSQPDFEFDKSDEGKRERQDEIEEYLHGLARIIMMEGIDVTPFSGQVLDPSPAFNVAVDLIAAKTGIPKRVLLGSAAGELAAAEEDTKQWYGTVAERQANFAEPMILRGFIDRLQALGVLPATPNGYDVGELGKDGKYHWPALYTESRAEQAEVMAKEAEAQRKLADPFTGQLLITEEEARGLLGYPPEPASEAEGEIEPMRKIVAMARQNVARGMVSREHYAAFLAAELADVGGE